MTKSHTVLLFVLMLLTIASCTQKGNKEPSEDNAEEEVVGTWKAEWETDPASYPGVEPSTKFTMDGQFEFNDEGIVTIAAYGHEGCIFSSDTLIHSLNWILKNDTLRLVNENDVHGMTYSVISRSADKMKLQLMEDIFLNLEKK
ncbi:MAG: hypothetical protein JXQ96_05430 [Cyclobacteriaceae bacterium]